MEVELKYKITSREQAERIWNDELFADIEENGSRAKISIKAAYFDTKDMLLSENRIAFRIRREGNRVVGTLKWGDKDVDESGLYVREEINVPVTDKACFLAPDPTIFRQSEEGRKMVELLGGGELVNIFETVFTRRKFRVDTGSSLMEISLDEGEIIADDAKAPIHELEVELYSGNRDDLIAIGNKLVEKYGISPETRSKYARGIALIK
ncbi:MAG: CYTH domain-containing protein [Clostridiales Family XIII bacterium]|jgi:triphosphatase|nr:CYTH domain-containing protein [Clostridiales Family XIII bacterium]